MPESTIQKGDLVPQPHGGAIKPGKKGEVRNPKGRTTLGAYVSECLNSLGKQQPSRARLRQIVRDAKTPSNMRIAAVRYLRMMEHPDMADFQDAVDGDMDLKTLRRKGIDTAVVKKMKTKRRTYLKDGQPESTEVEREIELHDRSREEFDTTLNRTDGHPKQPVEVQNDGDSLAFVLMARKFLDDNK